MKTLKKITALILLVCMILILPACGGGKKDSSTPSIDYGKMIDSFVSGPLNTFELIIGEEAAPNARVWLQDGGTVYCDNEAVVTVSELGKVTAVSKGSAHVVITDKTGTAFEVYRYDVYEPVPEADLSNLPAIDGIDFAYEIENFASSGLNTYKLKIGDMHSPNAAVWAKNGSCYTSDPTVVTVAENGTVSAVGRGTAYVIIKGSTSMYKIYKYIVNG